MIKWLNKYLGLVLPLALLVRPISTSMAKEADSFTVNGNGLAAGYYFISARNDYLQLAQKILLQNP